MKKSLLLSIAAILLLGITQKFDGQEKNQSYRHLPPRDKTVIERQSKMAQAPFFSRQEPDRWITDKALPHPHGMKKPMGQRDSKANMAVTRVTYTQHELSAGVDTAWVRHYASGLAPGEDAAAAIAVDGSGNICVTGSSVSFPSGHDYLTMKYDPSGTQLWVARYNGPENADDHATALVVDASGNVYVTGGSGTVKYNSEGLQLWVARYNGDHWAATLAVDISGNVYVTGSSYSSSTEIDFTTIKYSSDGVEQWVARYNSSGNLCDEARALAVDAFGNVYVTGEGGSLTTGTDFATVKYNSSGIQQWVACYNGPANSNDEAYALAVDGSGNVYVTGTSATIKYNSDGIQQWVALKSANALTVDASGNVYVTGSSYGSATGWDYATVKFNSDGVEQWVARYNWQGNAGDYANALAVDRSGNVYVTGRSGGDYDYDYATVKYNSKGVEQWVARYNGLENYADHAAALALDASGNVYVTGYTGSSDYYEYSGGPKSSDYATVKYNSSGIEQWIARYNCQGNCRDFSTDLAVDASGNVYVTGTSWISGTESDYATVKYNSDGVEQWIDRYNGTGNLYDEARALAVDASGNVYVTGWSWGSGTESDYATIKYNSDGVKQWVARYRGDGATALAVDASGNVYVTGESGGDFVTVKYGSDGAEQWVARNNGGSWASALAVDASGNVYVTGWSWNSGTESDYATVKYNSDGVEQWIAHYNGPGNDYDYAHSLAVDNSGNVYVTGESGSYYATVKYNSAGVRQWVARYNEPGSWGARAISIAVDSSGNIYVTGGCGGWGTYSDFTTVKYNSAGVQQWVTRCIGGEAVALAVDTFGNVYVTGSSGGDIATVKYNSAGVEQWIARYNGPGNSNDKAAALALDAFGNVYVTGTSSGGNWSVYTTIKYTQTPVLVEQEEHGRPSCYWLAQNYPNPFNPNTTIEFALPKSAFVTLKVYNLLGKEVATLIGEQRSAGIHKFNWDAKGLASGVYLYRLEAGDPSANFPNKSGQAGQGFVQVKKLVLMR